MLRDMKVPSAGSPETRCVAIAGDPGYGGIMYPMLRAAGFLIPVIPLWRTLRDQNKRFFTFVERPLMGIPAGLVGTSIARATAAALLGGVSHVTFWHNFFETYCSYQSANLIRNGVNVDERLTNRIKITLNYWYSVAVYSIFTAADKFAQAQDRALAEVGYAMLWPLLSQQIATYVVTPMLFGRFPKKDLLDQLQRSGVSTMALRAAVDEEARQLQTQPPSADDPSGARAQYELRCKRRWLEYFRRDLADNAPTPARRLTVHWLIKTSVSVGMSAAMIASYFTLRFCLVGFGDHVGPLVGLGRSLVYYFSAQ